MLDHVLRAFDLLINSGELGNADSRNLNTLSPHLDAQAEIGRAELADLLFSGSKDKDGACRSFLSRLKAGAAQAAEEAERSGRPEAAAVFRSLTVARIKAKGGAPRLRFSAEAPKELPQMTARANQDYLPEEYQPSTGYRPKIIHWFHEQEPSLCIDEEKSPCSLLAAGRKELYDDGEFIDVRGERAEICTAGERRLIAEKNVTSCEALADLFDWLENSEASLYALLGDYGMGKTFTCRIFAQRLAERCKQKPLLPRPVYLDLRDVPTFVTFNGVTRQPTLEEMLETVLRLNGLAETYTAKELIEAAQKGKLLCIFDGLDEKLVYYTNDMRSQFLNELLRVFPQSGRTKVKIVISCRTHHFETITQMDSFLLGLNRCGLCSDDYRALHLLPFSAKQMLALLTKLLGSEEAEQIFAFIDGEAYLKDLAQRPFLLRQLSRLLPKLRELKKQGRPVNAADFYQALIEDCLSRDDEKNLIKPRHKQQFLMDLAAEFWKNSTQLWPVNRLNDWFCVWLHKQPELATQYNSVDSQLLEKDLRNSTLLIRFGECDFGFSHSSMQEFFLSRWLLRQWQEDKNFSMNQSVSELTRHFLYDSLASLANQELELLNCGLAATLTKPWSHASDLALEIIKEQANRGITVPELTIIDMRKAQLNRRKIRGVCGNILFLDRAEAHRSQWIDCHFKNIEIGKGDISESLWRCSSWEEFDISRSTDLRLLQRVTMSNCKGSYLLNNKSMPFLFLLSTKGSV